MMPILLRYLKMLGGFLVLWIGIFIFNSFSCEKIESKEMEPTLKAEGHKMISPVNSIDDLKQEDVISFKYSGERKQPSYAARVIGLPGDKVEIRAGEVILNGNKMSSNYVSQGSKSPATENYAEIIVPRDCVYVLCDNRRSFDKSDSRAFGPIGLWAITGKFK